MSAELFFLLLLIAYVWFAVAIKRSVLLSLAFPSIYASLFVAFGFLDYMVEKDFKKLAAQVCILLSTLVPFLVICFVISWGQ